MQILNEQDLGEEGSDAEKSAQEITRIISELAERKSTYESYAEKIRETEDTQMSLTDPDSRLMMSNGKMDICYNVQTAVDAKNKLLVDFEITNSAVDKNQLARMVGLATDALGEKELEVTADVGYDSATDIAECLMRGATPHVAGVDYDICLPTNDEQIDEIISHTNGRGIYLANRNIAVCPMCHVLYPGGYKKHGGRALFYNYKACTGCICKCTAARYKKFEIVMKSADFRKKYDDKNLHVKQVRVTASKAIVRQRKSIVEHPFGTVKRTMDAGYCLTRGKHKVSGEMSLAFLAYNLKRVINIIGVRELIDAVQA